MGLHMSIPEIRTYVENVVDSNKQYFEYSPEEWNVPVDYTLLVEVLQAQQDLGGVEAGPLLVERLVPLQEIEHLA